MILLLCSTRFHSPGLFTRRAGPSCRKRLRTRIDLQAGYPSIQLDRNASHSRQFHLNLTFRDISSFLDTTNSNQCVCVRVFVCASYVCILRLRRKSKEQNISCMDRFSHRCIRFLAAYYWSPLTPRPPSSSLLILLPHSGTWPKSGQCGLVLVNLSLQPPSIFHPRLQNVSRFSSHPHSVYLYLFIFLPCVFHSDLRNISGCQLMMSQNVGGLKQDGGRGCGKFQAD